MRLKMCDKYRQLFIVVCLEYLNVPFCISLYRFNLWGQGCLYLRRPPEGIFKKYGSSSYNMTS